MNYINHYTFGLNTFRHKSKIVATSLNSSFDSYMESIQKGEFDMILIPAGYEHRPDLISKEIYGTVVYDWLIMMVNNIKDPFQELNPGDKLIVPRI